ncbi:hypothetical protein ACH5A3_39315 [Streptomyces echinatus]|uniref:hypothetical protein n=1 Tax=Streptomyces echinatus TaxID=67293 RepID=UPI0037904D8E
MSTDIPQQPTAPPAPVDSPTIVPAPPTVKRQMRPLAAGLIGLAVGAGVVGGAWVITANSHSGPGTFTLTGTFALTDSVGSDGDGGCKGRYDSGYDDIAEGTGVTVYGAAGDVVATGELGDSSQDFTTCTFKVSVPDVPKGEKFYKVEISHRGTLQLTAKEAENGGFAGSLG